MPEIRQQRPGGSGAMERAEIHIPDDKDLGTGTFTSVSRPDSLPSPKVIVSSMVNPPSFQLSLTINPSGTIPVLLGRADGSPPKSSKKYRLPSELDSSKSHELLVRFKSWEITSLELDGLLLSLENGQ